MGSWPGEGGGASMMPSNGSTLTGASQAFSWTGTGSTEYFLGVGASQAAVANAPWGDIFAGSTGIGTSMMVNGLPTDGSTIYVRLWNREGGAWLFTDFTYTAAGGGLIAVTPWSQVLPAAQRFVLVMGDAAVLDKETGLVWERSPWEGETIWVRAIEHCATREVGGRKGWHLPMLEQLASLVDPSNSNPALPTGHPFQNVFVGMGTPHYWTATTSASNPTDAWLVNFKSGEVVSNDKNPAGEGPRVWCVRGGQSFDGNTH